MVFTPCLSSSFITIKVRPVLMSEMLESRQKKNLSEFVETWILSEFREPCVGNMGVTPI